MFSRLSFNRDPYLALFYIVCALLAAYLIATGKVTFRELAGFGAGSALVPALVRSRQREDGAADPIAPPSPPSKAPTCPAPPDDNLSTPPKDAP